jgi:hypothetical protein
MATGLLIDIIEVGSSHAESVISERNLMCQYVALSETIKVIWHVHCFQIYVIKICFKT